jgi:2-C-methyl-D-erythritol 2,4-cyclodiphosphate synthase
MVLGGVRVESPVGLAGHSDADAVLHAVTDAILGAIGGPDIGDLFPDIDPRWKDADSSVFLKAALERAAGANMAVANCDVTVIAEQPKLSRYKQPMGCRLADLLGVAPSAVAIKAKTNEGMGWIGRGEGLAVIAAVLLEQRPA